MKHLSTTIVAMATALLFLCTSFLPSKENNSVSTDNTHYYWYTDNGTQFQGWYTISQEVFILEDEYGVLVDGNPSGGTLLASGYPFKGIPHLTFPSILLYGHF